MVGLFSYFSKVSSAEKPARPGLPKPTDERINGKRSMRDPMPPDSDSDENAASDISSLHASRRRPRENEDLLADPHEEKEIEEENPPNVRRTRNVNKRVKLCCIRTFSLSTYDHIRNRIFGHSREAVNQGSMYFLLVSFNHYKEFISDDLKKSLSVDEETADQHSLLKNSMIKELRKFITEPEPAMAEQPKDRHYSRTAKKEPKYNHAYLTTLSNRIISDLDENFPTQAALFVVVGKSFKYPKFSNNVPRPLSEKLKEIVNNLGLLVNKLA